MMEEEEEQQEQQQHNQKVESKGERERERWGDLGLFQDQYLSLHTKLIEVIESYSLVNFHTCNIAREKSLGRILAHVDKANGYMVGGLYIYMYICIYMYIGGCMDVDI